MPSVTYGHLNIDFTDDGNGDPLILIHCSVSGNRQWRYLSEALRERYRVLAINLFGYGTTTPWRGNSPQTLADQADLVLGLCKMTHCSYVHIVGHSYGGAVALKTAAILDNRVGGLVLWEPSPFYVLAQHGRHAAYEEAHSLRDHVKHYGSLGRWEIAAERFADYWGGDGVWNAMSPKQRSLFVEAIPNNFHEWDGVIDEDMPISEWKNLKAKTLLVCSKDTKRPIREIVELAREGCPHWEYVEIPSGGHMAPLTRPDLVTPVVADFLNSVKVCGKG